MDIVFNTSASEVVVNGLWPSLTILNRGEILVALSVFVLSTVILFVAKQATKKKYNLPPGPVGLPFVGYMPFIGKKPHKTLNKLREKYGNVFGLYLGRQYTIVLNDIASIKEAFSKNDFSGRPWNLFKFTDIYENIINMNGKIWIDHMRFNKTILRELGMGKGIAEEMMKEELQHTLQKIEKKLNKDVDINELLASSVDNVIYSMICGKRYDEGDPMAQILQEYQIYSQRYFASSSIHAYFPYLTKLCLWLHPLLRGATKAFRDIENALCKEIKIHEKTLDENNLTDFLDYSLVEVKKRNGENEFTRDTLNGTAQILILGGSETSRVTLEWSFMLLAKHQHVQEKAYREIVEVHGTEKVIGWNDRDSLPYLNALIYEIQRRKTLVPLNVLRRTQRDTTVGGFEIPENTTVITNIWAVHMDPNSWENPKLFDPERFLVNGGTKAKAPENHIPFSYGQRMCPSERLASMQLFISLSNLIQKFKFKPPSSGEIDFSGELRLVYVPNKPIVQIENR